LFVSEVGGFEFCSGQVSKLVELVDDSVVLGVQIIFDFYVVIAKNIHSVAPFILIVLFIVCDHKGIEFTIHFRHLGGIYGSQCGFLVEEGNGGGKKEDGSQGKNEFVHFIADKILILI